MIDDSLKAEELVALLQKCSPKARILVYESDDDYRVLELIEYRIYTYEADPGNPEVIFHFEIPDWKALGVRVVSQNGKFVETVYE